jgi:hypothetical protein
MLERLVEGTQGGVLDQELLNDLIAAAELADTVEGNAGGTEEFFNTAVNAGVGSISISNDTGIDDSDFVTNASTQTITSTLASELGEGQAIYGSVDGGLTWVAIADADGSSVSSTTVSWSTSLSDSAENPRIVMQITDNGQPPAADNSNVVGTDWTFDLSNLVFADHGFAFQLEDASDPGVSLISASAEVSVLVSDALSSLARGTTLYLGGVDRELDLTQISGTSQLRIDAIELGDLVGGGSNSVTLNIDDVLSAGADLYNVSNGWEGLLSDGSNQLRIAGDSGDEVVLTDLADWTKASGTTTFNGLVYDICTNGSAQLLIEQELSVL